MKNQVNQDFCLRWLRFLLTRFIVASVILFIVIRFIGLLKNPSSCKDVYHNKKECIKEEIIEENDKKIIVRARKIKIEEKYNNKKENDLFKQTIKYIFSEVKNVEHLAAIIGLIVLTFDIPNQHKRTNYEAWQVINLAQGKGGSGGRIEAFEHLNKEQVSLAGVVAFYADLTGIKLEKADLRRANFKKTYLNNSQLKGANLKYSILNCAELRKTNLNKADLSHSDLTDAKLENADLRKANLSEAKLINADLVDARLDRADLTAVHLKDADLRNANLCCVDLSRSDLTNANLSRTNIKKSNLRGAKLWDANLWHSNLNEAQLWNADLSCANLSRANLKGTDFRNANLSDVDLSYADLSHANFKGAENLTPEQVKVANNWHKADYDPEFRKQLGL